MIKITIEKDGEKPRTVECDGYMLAYHFVTKEGTPAIANKMETTAEDANAMVLMLASNAFDRMLEGGYYGAGKDHA